MRNDENPNHRLIRQAARMTADGRPTFPQELGRQAATRTLGREELQHVADEVASEVQS